MSELARRLERLLQAGEKEDLAVASDLCEEQGWALPLLVHPNRLRINLGRRTWATSDGYLLSWTGGFQSSRIDNRHATTCNAYSGSTLRPRESYRIVDGHRGGYTGAVSNYVGTLWVSEAGLDE